MLSVEECSDECTCGDPTPYQPKGICAPMMPIGSCMNCYPRGRPRTVYEQEVVDKMHDDMLNQLDKMIELVDRNG